MSGEGTSHGTAQLVIEGPGEARALEFKAFLFPLVGPATADLPAPPGAAWHDAAGRPTLLHFAPGRFLAPVPTAELARHLAALEAARVGSLFDVNGKWRVLAVTGHGAERLLAAGADVEAMLQHRDCAALTLFDCPVVVARAPGGYALFAYASYAQDLRASLERLRPR